MTRPGVALRDPFADRQAIPLREQVQKLDRPPRQSLLPHPPRQQPQRPNGQARTTDDVVTKQRPAKYSSSIMNSSPDMFLYNQAAPQPVQEDLIATISLPPVAPQEKVAPPPATEDQDMLRQGSDITSISNISRQPSVPESSLTANGHHGASSVVSGLSAERNLPKQTSTAEEVMRDYLVGEGIKKAHFRALHPKAPKKKKTGFFGSFLSRSSKT